MAINRIIYPSLKPIILSELIDNDEYYYDIVGTRFRKIFHTNLRRVSFDDPTGLVTDDYFETAIVAEAVVAAEDQFTMIEAGCGFGRWLLTAYSLAKRFGKPDVYLIGIEADPIHFTWTKMAFVDNGVPKDKYKLLQKAVVGSRSNHDDRYFLTIADNPCEDFDVRPRESYGQTVIDSKKFFQLTSAESAHQEREYHGNAVTFLRNGRGG